MFKQVPNHCLCMDVGIYANSIATVSSLMFLSDFGTITIIFFILFIHLFYSFHYTCFYFTLFKKRKKMMSHFYYKLGVRVGGLIYLSIYFCGKLFCSVPPPLLLIFLLIISFFYQWLFCFLFFCYFLFAR